jgi:hypothetical protein
VPLFALVGLKFADARKTKREAALARAALHDAGGGAPPQKGCCRKRGQVQVGQARVVAVKPRGDPAEDGAAEADAAGPLPVVAADMLRALRKAFAAFDWSVDRVEDGRAAAVSGLRRGAAAPASRRERLRACYTYSMSESGRQHKINARV